MAVLESWKGERREGKQGERRDASIYARLSCSWTSSLHILYFAAHRPLLESNNESLLLIRRCTSSRRPVFKLDDEKILELERFAGLHEAGGGYLERWNKGSGRKVSEGKSGRNGTRLREKEDAMVATVATHLNDDRVLSLDDVLDVGKIYLSDCERAIQAKGSSVESQYIGAAFSRLLAAFCRYHRNSPPTSQQLSLATPCPA
jgi:hypothetical protein